MGGADRVSRKDAKAHREKVGYERRVCVAVLVDRFGTREQIDSDDHFANVANGVDRGTYQGSHVSRKGAKERKGFSFSSQPEAYQDSIPMSHAKTQRRKADRQGREIIFGCSHFCLFWLVFSLRSWRLERSGREKWFGALPLPWD